MAHTGSLVTGSARYDASDQLLHVIKAFLKGFVKENASTQLLIAGSLFVKDL